MTSNLGQTWTQRRFFDWIQTQEAAYEFDGSRPIPMPITDLVHSAVAGNLLTALANSLRGTRYLSLRLAGIETVNSTVRYPDVLVTCSKIEPKSNLVRNAVAVFEVVGPDPLSNYTDRIEKVREYAAVGTICRYILVESTSVALTSWSVAMLMMRGLPTS